MAEARFRLPDGRTGTMRGASMPELYRKAQEMGAELVQPQEAAGTTTQAVNNAVGARSLGAMSNTAERVLNAPGKALNPLLSAMFPSGEIRTTAGLPGIPAQIPQINLPSGQQIAAAMESPMQAMLAGQSLGSAFDARMGDRQQIAADRPAATMAGEIATDAAALAALRRIPRGPQAGGAFDRYVAQGVDGLKSLINPAKLTSGARAFGSDVVGSGAMRSLAQGTARVGESALEGAALSVMQNGDPASMAAAGAGMQAAGSMGNQLRDVMIGKPGTFNLNRIAGTIAAGTVALGLLAEGLPFDPDNPTDPLEWLSANFEKVAGGALLGFAVGMLGRRGSVDPRTMGNYFPNMADALSSVPRASVLEMVRESRNDESLARALQNTSALGASDAKRFTEIMRSDSPADGLREWMNSNERIRRILSAPDPRLAGVPVKESD